MGKIWPCSLGVMASKSWVLRKTVSGNNLEFYVKALIMKNLELILEKCKYEN